MNSKFNIKFKNKTIHKQKTSNSIKLIKNRKNRQVLSKMKFENKKKTLKIKR
jgi:hypothetical protein